MVFTVWLHQRHRRRRVDQRTTTNLAIVDTIPMRGYVLTNLERSTQRMQRTSELEPAPAYTPRVHDTEESPPSYEQCVASLETQE